jgi:hypothetical protein
MATTFLLASSPVRSQRKLPKNLDSRLVSQSAAALLMLMPVGLAQLVQKSNLPIMNLIQNTLLAMCHKLLPVLQQ